MARASRVRLPVERLTGPTVHYWPDICEACDDDLSAAPSPDDSEPRWYQVVEQGAGSNADMQDQEGARLVLTRRGKLFRHMKVIWADSAYSRNDLPSWVQRTFEWILQTWDKYNLF